MLKNSPDKFIYRIIDANINRAKEGLRVCEEIARFALNRRLLCADFKQLRHRLDGIIQKLPSRIFLISSRESSTDAGRKNYHGELAREDCRDIFFANIQRVKESVRVLEEFSKLIHKNIAVAFKEARYDIYEVEKRAAGAFASLCHRK